MLVSFLVLEPMVSWYVLVGSCVDLCDRVSKQCRPTKCRPPLSTLRLAALSYAQVHASHVYRVPWAVTVFWCGLAAAGFLCYVMLCYVLYLHLLSVRSLTHDS